MRPKIRKHHRPSPPNKQKAKKGAVLSQASVPAAVNMDQDPELVKLRQEVLTFARRFKQPFTATKFENKYRKIGGPIPSSEFGFSSLNDFLQKHPGLSFASVNGCVKFHVRTSEETEASKSATLSRATTQAAGEVDQGPDLAELRQTVLLVARGLKQPFTAVKFKNEYKTIGRPIPLQKYGFSSFVDFLQKHPGLAFTSVDGSVKFHVRTKKPKVKKSAALGQASAPANVKVEQELELAKLCQEVLIVAIGLKQPFRTRRLRKKYRKPVPFEKFGFLSLKDFLIDHPDLSLVENRSFLVRTPDVEDKEPESESPQKSRQRVLEGSGEKSPVAANESAVLSQASVKAAVNLGQGPDLAKLRQEVLYVARGLEQPFSTTALRKKFGKRIPFVKFGFPSLTHLLRHHPDLSLVGNRSFCVRMPEVDDKETEVKESGVISQASVHNAVRMDKDMELAALRQEVLNFARGFKRPFTTLNFKKEYIKIGGSVPFRKLGFSSYAAFLRKHPGLAFTSANGCVKFHSRKPEVDDEEREAKKSATRSQAPVQAAGEVDQDPKLAKLHQKVLYVARGLKQPFSTTALSKKYGQRITFKKFGIRSLTDFLISHPELSLTWNGRFRFRTSEVDDKVTEVKKTAALCQASVQVAVKMAEDPGLVKLRQEVLLSARGLTQPFSTTALRKKYGKPIPFEKFGFPSLENFLIVHPDLIHTGNGSFLVRGSIPSHKFGYSSYIPFPGAPGRSLHFGRRLRKLHIRESRPTAPLQKSRKRVLEGSGEKSPVAARKKRQKKVAASSGGSSLEESVDDAQKPETNIARDSRLDVRKQVKGLTEAKMFEGLAERKEVESSKDCSSNFYDDTVPLKKTCASRLAAPKELKGEEASAKGKEASADDSRGPDSPPVSKKPTILVKIKREEPSADPCGLIESEVSFLSGSTSNVPNVAPPVGWNDSFVSPRGGFFAPQFNPMACPPLMMPYHTQSFPVPPSKNELFGQLVTRFLDDADREGQDSNDFTRDLMKAISKFNKKKS